MPSGLNPTSSPLTTRLDAASDFFGEENVPKRAITMGVGTIMNARKIILMAWGEGKSNIIQQAVEGEIIPLPQALRSDSQADCFPTRNLLFELLPTRYQSAVFVLKHSIGSGEAKIMHVGAETWEMFLEYNLLLLY